VLVVVVVVEVGGAIGMGAIGTVLVDCSVVVVRVTLSGLLQLATKAVPATSATPIMSPRPDFVLLMGNSMSGRGRRAGNPSRHPERRY
jgi:hypothetical protein